jgi:membrane protease YdiL (CAAX protease family)
MPENIPLSSTAPAALPAIVQRMANHSVGQFVLALLITLVPFIIANAIAKLTLDGEQWLHLRNAFKVAVLTMAYCYYVRRIEQRAVTELALPGALTELGRGFGLATVLIAVPVVLLWVGGYFKVQGITLNFSLLHLFVGFFSVAVLEELLFRAILFRLLERSLGTVHAIVVSSALFSAVHLLNPHADWLSTLQLLVLGLLFIAAFLYTRRLWLCVGLHWGWNYAQGGLFSSPVSGTKAEGLFQSTMTGPAWLTGGDFGIEASLLTSVGALICTVLLLKAAGKQHWVLPYWQRQATTAAAD